MTQIKEIGLYTVTLVNELNIRVSFIFKDSIIYCKHYKSKKAALKHFETITGDIEWHTANNMAWQYTGLMPKVFLVGILKGDDKASYFVGYEDDSVERVIKELFGEEVMVWTVSRLKGRELTSGIYKTMSDRIKLLKV